MSDDAKSLFAHQAHFETKRANWDSWWQQLTERALPSQAQITTTSEEGQKRTERQFDSRAVFANERFGAVMDGLLTPETQLYHGMVPDDDGEEADQEEKVHLERVNKAIYKERYRPDANFASQKMEGYLSLGVIGNSCMFISEDVVRGPVYIGCHMREVYWAENKNGLVDTLNRKFPMCAGVAVKFFAEMGITLPAKIVTAAEKEPYREFDFLHVTRPNDDRKPGRKDYRGMAFSSHYLCYEDEKMLGAGGYKEWPYAIGRYHKGVREVYARSPAMTAWPAICTLNEEKKTILRVGQREVEPPILLTEEGLLEAFSLKPGALNYGGLTTEGGALAQPFKTGGNVPLGMELMELEGRDVDEAFLATIYKVMLDHPQMTATQVLELVQQRAILLGGAGKRFFSEDLSPMMLREVGILSRMSKYRWIGADMPDRLRERGGRYRIQPNSPLSRAMRAGDGIAITRTFETLGPASQLDPGVGAHVDVQGAFRELCEINGFPAKFLRDPKIVKQMLANKQQQEEAANIASVAPEMSQAVLNIAKAQQARQPAT